MNELWLFVVVWPVAFAFDFWLGRMTWRRLGPRSEFVYRDLLFIRRTAPRELAFLPNGVMTGGLVGILCLVLFDPQTPPPYDLGVFLAGFSMLMQVGVFLTGLASPRGAQSPRRAPE